MDITIEKPCMFCGNKHSVTIPEEGLKAWQAGALIQDAMPHVSADDREFLISGICPKCWKETFHGR